MSPLPFFYGWVSVAIAFATMGVGVNARTPFSLQLIAEHELGSQVISPLTELAWRLPCSPTA